MDAENGEDELGTRRVHQRRHPGSQQGGKQVKTICLSVITSLELTNSLHLLTGRPTQPDHVFENGQGAQ